MKTIKEQIAENIEHVFDNTKRIHGNSEALDWIKIAIHRSAEFIYHKYLKAQAEQESILNEFANKIGNQKDIDPEIRSALTPEFFNELMKESTDSFTTPQPIFKAEQEHQNISNDSQIRNELYEKVYIRSEADLPKEEGWYICSGKGQLRKYYWRNGESDIWIISNRIDWYLRPLEAEQPSNNRQQSKDSANNLKTAEEILNRKTTFTDRFGIRNIRLEYALEAMEEYAIQFKQEKVTDECLSIVKDLAEWSEKYPRGVVYPMSRIIMDEELVALEERAKAMRDGLITHNK